MKAKNLLFILAVAAGPSGAADGTAEQLIWSGYHGDYVPPSMLRAEPAEPPTGMFWSDFHGDYVPVAIAQSDSRRDYIATGLVAAPTENLVWTDRYGDYVPAAVR